MTRLLDPRITMSFCIPWNNSRQASLQDKYCVFSPFIQCLTALYPNMFWQNGRFRAFLSFDADCACSVVRRDGLGLDKRTLSNLLPSQISVLSLYFSQNTASRLFGLICSPSKRCVGRPAKIRPPSYPPTYPAAFISAAEATEQVVNRRQMGLEAAVPAVGRGVDSGVLGRRKRRRCRRRLAIRRRIVAALLRLVLPTLRRLRINHLTLWVRACFMVEEGTIARAMGR